MLGRHAAVFSSLTLLWLTSPVASINDMLKGRNGRRLMRQESAAAVKDVHTDAKTGGSPVQLLIGGKGNCQKSAFPSAGQFYRSSYNKRIRCSKDTTGENLTESCEECSQSDNCWRGVDHQGGGCPEGAVKIQASGNGEVDNSHLKIEATDANYSRFINRAFVLKGGGGAAKMVAKNIAASHGDVRFFFDGQLISEGTGDINHEWTDGTASNASLSSGNALSLGPHEFVVEFTPDSTPAEASIGTLYFEFDSGELSCKESDPTVFSTAGVKDTSCFSHLHGDTAIHLRHSNEALESCLDEPQWQPTDSSGPTVCDDYKSCLQAADAGVSLSSLEHMVNARNASHGSSCTVNYAMDLQKSEEFAATCFDPLLQDLQELNCECATNLKASCQKTCPTINLDECFTAIACNHPKVCMSWKICYCSPAVGSAQDHCQTAHALLQQGRATSATSPLTSAKSLMRRSGGDNGDGDGDDGDDDDDDDNTVASTVASTLASTVASTMDAATTHKCVG